MIATLQTTERKDIPDALRWNHNIHYYDWLLKYVPAAATQVLDIGCGDGMLVRQLSARCHHVIGIDLDAQSIAQAQRLTMHTNVSFVLGDAMTYPFPGGSFDAIFSVATLHHLDTQTALQQMAKLLRPGGRLGIIGIGRTLPIRDLHWQGVGTITHWLYRLKKTMWEHSSPTVWPPPHTNYEVRRIASAVLPGCQFRRHILWRYSLVWRKPL